MKTVNGIQIPETLEDARLLNYADLEKAAKNFNEYSVSAEDIKKAWDKHYWDGFDTAINFAVKIILDSRWGTEDVALELEEEAKKYKDENK